MTRIAIFLIAFSLDAANVYYVSSAGSDSNPGSQGSPWLTLAHAVGLMQCGDTLNVVANGSFVNDGGNVNLPAFANCAATNTIQSSALAQFAAAGYRTNPTIDNANYGKLTFTGQGITITPGVWTFNTSFGYASISLNASTSVFTVASPNGLSTYARLVNGSQVELEVNSEASNYGGVVYPSVVSPGGVNFLTHYYVVNCGSGPVGSRGYPQTCGQVNSNFQLAAAPGGSPISITSCGAYCATTVTVDPSGSCTTGQIQYNTTDSTPWGCANGSSWTQTYSPFMVVGFTVAADTSASTLTIPINFGPGTLSEGTAIALSTAGLQLFGTLPSPLQVDAIYYVENLSGNTFQVALTPGGTPITLTSIGTGMINLASTAIASNWAFRGLEMTPNGNNFPVYFFLLGKGSETSIYGMTSHNEVDRCYLHDNPPAQGIVHAIVDNGTFLNIHDSWIIGADNGEAQAIQGTMSLGPTTITNNFLEASGEVSLYGGDWSPYGQANSHKIFSGNYFYKPPIWKIGTGTVPATGACLYDATDPTHAGGEWWKDTSSGLVYQCNSSGTWGSTVSSFPAQTYVIKNMTEHKNGRYFTYTGNLYNYSIAQDQSGQLWNNSMEYGDSPGAANDHITIMNNVGYNSLKFMTRATQCGLTSNAVCPILPGTHATVNNLLVTNPLVCGTNFAPLCGFRGGDQAQVGGVAPYFNGDLWNHNTIYQQDSYPFTNITPMYAPTPTGACPPYNPIPVNQVSYQNSIVPGDFLGDCNSAGVLIASNYSNSTFLRNALKGATGNYSNVGPSNTWTGAAFPTSNAAIGYINGTGGMAGNYQLAPTSPYSAQNPSATQLSDDGTDLGADIDLINMATSGAAAGTPTWDQQAGLRVDAGSGQVVFRYTSPTVDVCTATVYGAPARIPANQVAVVADSSANSLSNANARELYVSGVQPATRYWYKLACGGGVLMVGNFLTRAAGHQNLQFSFDWSTPTPMQYSSSRNMSSAVSLPAATRQYIPVAANSLVYVQTGVVGPMTMLIAP
jgi:hypothetical protein